jgi:hypothetical protein
MQIDGLISALSNHGLILRGGIVFGADEARPEGARGPSGGFAKSLLLVGHGGGTAWPHFISWREKQPKDIADPLDTWSRQVIGAVAGACGARAVFPSDEPWLPFQQWAMRAEGLKPSPLGILMHPVFGLWHAYRGALLFDAEVSTEVPQETSNHCDQCVGRPCLNACPVSAFSRGGFDVAACRSYLTSPIITCVSGGCQARAACPHSTYKYSAKQLSFHIAAFYRGITSR